MSLVENSNVSPSPQKTIILSNVQLASETMKFRRHSSYIPAQLSCRPSCCTSAALGKQ